MSYKVGIIGLGNAGKAICLNLHKKGHEVYCLDLNTELYKDLPEDILPVSSAREMAEKTTHIITALPKPIAVIKCVEGETGLFAGASPGLVWVDASTTDRKQTIELGQKAKEKGIIMLEGTMTGGMMALKNNKMVCLAGGDKNDFEAHKWFMQHSIGPVVKRCGEIGSGAIAKVASNMLAFLNMAGGIECMALAKNAGLDLETFFDAIRASAGNSFAWETVMPVMFNGDYDPGFTMELACKDMWLAYNLGRDLQVPLPLHGMVEQMMQMARLKYGNQAGCYIYPKLLSDIAGIDMHVDGWENWNYNLEHVEGSAVIVHKNRPAKK